MWALKCYVKVAHNFYRFWCSWLNQLENYGVIQSNALIINMGEIWQLETHLFGIGDICQHMVLKHTQEYSYCHHRNSSIVHVIVIMASWTCMGPNDSWWDGSPCEPKLQVDGYQIISDSAKVYQLHNCIFASEISNYGHCRFSSQTSNWPLSMQIADFIWIIVEKLIVKLTFRCILS